MPHRPPSSLRWCSAARVSRSLSIAAEAKEPGFPVLPEDRASRRNGIVEDCLMDVRSAKPYPANRDNASPAVNPFQASVATLPANGGSVDAETSTAAAITDLTEEVVASI